MIAATPLKITAIWSKTFKLAKASASKIWYWLLLYTAIAALGNFVVAHMMQTLQPKATAITIAAIFYAIVFIVNLYFLGLVYLLLQKKFINSTETFNALSKMALMKIPKFIVIYIIFLVLLLIGTLALVIPGLYCMTVLWMAVPVLFFEPLPIFATIKRAFSLVRGNWWRTFAVLMCPVIVIIIALVLIAAVTGSIHMYSTPAQSPTLAYRIVSGIAAYIFGFYLLPLAVVQYNDLKLRKEIKNQKGKI